MEPLNSDGCVRTSGGNHLLNFERCFYAHNSFLHTVFSIMSKYNIQIFTYCKKGKFALVISAGLKPEIFTIKLILVNEGYRLGGALLVSFLEKNEGLIIGPWSPFFNGTVVLHGKKAVSFYFFLGGGDWSG